MKLRSSSSLLVAVLVVLGFVLGSVSTASAGPALTKKVVKKIAAKVVKKAAPTLSVAHADTATNASNLNGLPADAYLGRIAFAGTVSSVSVTGGVDTQFATLNLTVPATATFVRITGSLTFDTPGAPNLATIWASVDKPCPDPTGIGFDQRSQMSQSSIRDRGTTDYVTKLAPGVHQIRLCGLAQVNGTAIGPQLVAQTIPLNGAGSTS
jgi:hypothetical protein